jgi:hypothetical protein
MKEAAISSATRVDIMKYAPKVQEAPAKKAKKTRKRRAVKTQGGFEESEMVSVWDGQTSDGAVSVYSTSPILRNFSKLGSSSPCLKEIKEYPLESGKGSSQNDFSDTESYHAIKIHFL